jgi:PAS domain S-box-containing protein
VLLAAFIIIFVAATIASLVAIQRGRAELREMTALAAATSRAGVLMAETLGEVDTLPSVVGAMVPDVADWAVVHLVADHGGITRAALAHRDPQMHAEIERQHQDRMFNPDLPYGPANVIRTGIPLFAGRVSSDFVTRVSQRYKEEGRILKGLASGSVISVPLRARTGVLGALTLGRRRRPYGKMHFAWAEDLGHRIGLAMENARLYKEARQLFEQTLSANYVSTPAGRILACNQAFAELLGFDSPQHVCEHPAPAFYPNPEERERALQTLRSDRRLVGYESAIRRLDGTMLSISENAVGTFDDHGELVRITGFVLDRSTVKSLEEQLRQSQRLEAVGQLAGGIAHDFNNLLTVIIGCADLLREAGQHAVVDGHDPLEELMKAAKRAAALTQQLLAFGRRQVLQPCVLDLNEALHNVHTMLRRLVRENIVIILSLDPGIDRVRVDPGQLDQVIVNLVMNSGDAMPKGGTITVSTSNKALTDADAKIYAYVRPGRFVSLTVADTGTGMAAATVARAFEPFFTTKPLGKGTGLGLSTFYGIVKQSGGYVWVHSELDRGTTVNVCLPTVVESQQTSAVPERFRPAS